MSIQDAVKDLRTKAGLPQQSLALMLGVTVTSVSRYEQGHSTPAVSVLRKLIGIAQENAATEALSAFQQALSAKLGALAFESLRFITSYVSRANSLLVQATLATPTDTHKIFEAMTSLNECTDFIEGLEREGI